MKRFFVNIISDKVVVAATIAERLLQDNSKMISEIKYKSDWEYPPVYTGQELADLLLKKRETIPVNSYRPFYWRSKVVAYFDGTRINFNIRKLDSMSVNDITGTLLHEYAHYCGLKHGNNFITENKLTKSVPYYLSENIKNWL